MNWGAVIVAAGRGRRLGKPKQFIDLAGIPMVGWSIRTFAATHEIEELVIVTEEDWLDRMSALARDLAPSHDVRVVAGGETRQASVYNGLEALSDKCDAVLVHDGARPLVNADDVRAGMREVRISRGAVLATPVVDTIKIVDKESKLVQRTLDRSELWAAQTPQFAMRRDLWNGHVHARSSGIEATDDVALLELVGIDVIVVPASDLNFKVTLPQDVARAEAILRERLEHA
jgi:2-C-methyl-D-erythritol 4-phosphate cytidylyltransferase